MLKVVVVEPEGKQRSMLKRIATENNLELEFIAVYINGLPALEYLLTGQGDIFIANVDAPTVDGISIVKKLKEENIDVKTIFLSDNADFKTVKEAAVLNPVAYILKPADDEEIKNSLIKAMDLCNKERAEQQEQEELRKKAEYSSQALKSQFVRDLLYQSALSDEYIEQSVKSFEFDLQTSEKTVAILKMANVENAEISYSILCAAAIYINNEYKKDSFYFFPVVMSEQELVVLVASKDRDDIFTEMKKLKDTISKRYDLNISLSVSQSHTDILKLSKLYTQAKKYEEWSAGDKDCSKEDVFDLEPSEEENLTKSDIIVKKIKKIISQQYSQRLTVEKIAAQISYSKKQTQRIFLKKTQKTIYEYMTEVRIEKAKEMLKEGKSKIYVVAEQVGYKNTAHFKELFKRYTGHTPAEYKKRQKTKRDNKEFKGL